MNKTVYNFFKKKPNYQLLGMVVGAIFALLVAGNLSSKSDAGFVAGAPIDIELPLA